MRRTAARSLLLGLTVTGCTAPRVSAQPATRLDVGSLLTPTRLAALPAAERAAWDRYVAASDAMRASDRAAMRRELDSLQLPRMLEAPHHDGFFMQPSMTGAWLQSDSGRRQTAVLLSWQTPSGGWSKRLDMSAAPRRPEWPTAPREMAGPTCRRSTTARPPSS
jgi:hypothetical protein